MNDYANFEKLHYLIYIQRGFNRCVVTLNVLYYAINELMN